MELIKPSGRVVYAFIATNRHHFRAAKLGGPRPVLFSAYYVHTHPRVVEMMQEWRDWMGDYRMIIDSGVYTFRSTLWKGQSQGVATAYNQMPAVEQAAFVKRGAEVYGEKIDLFVQKYIKFLIKTEGIWDYAIELDVDQFLGQEKTEEYYELLCNAIGKERIIRVWHSTRDFNQWVTWANDPEIKYLAIEGADQYKRSIPIYQRFVKHANGREVHILATTLPRFQKYVNSSTVDSSSHLQGGRTGSIQVPGVGVVAFSKKVIAQHFSRLSGADQQHVQEYIEAMGFDFEEAQEDWVVRAAVNLRYSDKHIDVSYVGEGNQTVKMDFINGEMY